jgi:drug/metabolite transporter (DMT)-like permease
MSGNNVGVLSVVVSAISFGFMPIFARLAYAQGVGVDELLFVRFLLAFLLMGGILAASGHLSLPTTRILLVLLGLGAFSYFLQSTFYFNALLYSPVAIVALILYTYPVFVTVCAFALGWEKISRRLASAFIIALAGLFLVVNPFGNSFGLGAILALGASLAYTIYILSGSKVLTRVRGDVAAFYVMGAATISFGVAGTLTGSIHVHWSAEGWFWVVMVTVVCSVIAITTFFLGLSKIGPSKAALISLVEPLTSILASLVVFGNALSLTQWVGGALILTATAITTINPRSQSHRYEANERALT